jgi:hypothetical protein
MGEAFLLSLQMYGLVIVVSMLVAAMIRVIVYTLSTMQKKRQRAAPAPAQPAVPAAAEPDSARDDIAVIAAAVYATVGMRRIIRIEDKRGASWTVGGRLAHHGSHAVPHRPRR